MKKTPSLTLKKDMERIDYQPRLNTFSNGLAGKKGRAETGIGERNEKIPWCSSFQ